MAFVQTSPFLGQVFNCNGEVDVVDDMSGTYVLVDMVTKCVFGEVFVQRVVCGQATCLHLFLPSLNLNMSFDELPIKGDNLGCRCWIGSFASVIWLTQQSNALCWNKHHQVLELGTGVGVCGVTLGKINNDIDITISDGVESLSTVAKENINQNMVNNVSFNVLKWGSTNTDTQQYDFIFGSECIYRDFVDDIVETILHCLKEDGKACFLNTPHPYRKGVLTFIQSLTTHGNVSTRELNLTYNGVHQAPFILIQFRKKSAVAP